MDLVAGAVCSIIRKLGTLLQAEYKLQKGLPEEIESLRHELETAHTALRMVGEVPREQLDPQVKQWASEVREASYDMKDILDSFLVHVVDAAAPGRSKNGLRKLLQKKMAMLFSKAKGRHTIAGAIEEMKRRLQEVADRRNRYAIPVALPAPVTTTLDPRLAYMDTDATLLIGVDKTRADLIAMLQHSSSGGHGHGEAHVSSGGGSSSKMKIVSVVGVGGLGKTTLAKAVYDEFKQQYDCAAFVSVGRKPDLVQVFSSIFYDLDREEYDAIREVKSLQLLIRELRKFLRNKRYFIIIDDVWDIPSWETIKSALDQNSSGSRVITTTRNRDIASEEVYELDPLSYDNSKKLFYTRLFGREGRCPADHPDEVSKKILDKCGGVPLAIITMASLLVGKSREDWFEVCNSPGFYRGKDNKQVDDTVWILSLSYYDLPSYLKTCLLYLSVYPEDHLIEKSSLIWKWIAEGFIEQKAGTSLSQQGDEYFHQLINRSMIQAVEEEERGICGCRVHDMVLDLIRDLSDEVSFVTVSNDDEGISSGGKVRRLAQQRRMVKHTHRHDVVAQVRSLVACGCDVVLHLSFKLLRVLDLESCRLVRNNGGHGLEHLGNLLHLRYLGLRNMKHLRLPEEIGALKHLQTLDLKGSTTPLLPWSICQLTQLACLRSGLSLVPDGFLRKVTSLEELEINGSGGYMDEGSERQFIQELGNLREVRVLRVLFFGVLSPSMQSDLLLSLGNLQKLRHLALRSFEQAAATREWDTVVLPRHLRLLVIQIVLFPCLPSWVNPAHLTSFSHLELFVDRIDEAGLTALGGLPELSYLSLRCFSLMMSYSKTTLVAAGITSTDGFFKKLRCFYLEGWIVQLVISEDSTSVSFLTWNGKGDIAFSSSETQSRVVAPAVAFMPNLQELAFDVPVEALYRLAVAF
ncbi:hypothetical protein U9M48_000181 [Paspalum notatum var. saurae]|uniref:AAA+ ATPase domain-containing protein n=1 Tax=Paspalum notatum var. saurae TaxID=547442 RepID=A0AAQ3PLW2_PASNO